MRNFEKLGKKIRKDILRLCFNAESGHIGGPLGAVELYLALYFLVLNEKSSFKNRDRVVISNGHYSALLYSILYQKGLISLKELNSFRIFKGIQGHPKKDESILIETSSGPLGEGLGQALGMAKLNLIENNPGYIYCLMGDGEQAEGSVWESCLLCNKLKVNNLTVIIDRNNKQIEGDTEDVLPLDSLKEKYIAFGFEVFEVDGHDILEISNILLASKKIKKSVCVICNTIFGKGVSFMEKNHIWHGKAISEELFNQAIKELND